MSRPGFMPSANALIGLVCAGMLGLGPMRHAQAQSRDPEEYRRGVEDGSSSAGQAAVDQGWAKLRQRSIDDSLEGARERAKWGRDSFDQSMKRMDSILDMRQRLAGPPLGSDVVPRTSSRIRQLDSFEPVAESGVETKLAASDAGPQPMTAEQQKARADHYRALKDQFYDDYARAQRVSRAELLSRPIDASDAMLYETAVLYSIAAGSPGALLPANADPLLKAMLADEQLLAGRPFSDRDKQLLFESDGVMAEAFAALADATDPQIRQVLRAAAWRVLQESFDDNIRNEPLEAYFARISHPIYQYIMKH